MELRAPVALMHSLKRPVACSSGLSVAQFVPYAELTGIIKDVFHFQSDRLSWLQVVRAASPASGWLFFWLFVSSGSSRIIVGRMETRYRPGAGNWRDCPRRKTHTCEV